MKKIKSERGQSLVELSISLVVILWLLAGAVEFGIAYFQFIQMRDAAQEGALYGSIHPDDFTGITTRVEQASSSPIDLVNDPGVSITPSYEDANGYYGVGCGIVVEVTYQHDVFMPFANLFMNDPITIRAEVVDTILQSPDSNSCL